RRFARPLLMPCQKKPKRWERNFVFPLRLSLLRIGNRLPIPVQRESVSADRPSERIAMLKSWLCMRRDSGTWRLLSVWVSQPKPESTGRKTAFLEQGDGANAQVRSILMLAICSQDGNKVAQMACRSAGRSKSKDTRER